MSDELFVKARRNPTFTGEGNSQELWANRLGSIVQVPLLDQLIAAGYGYHVTVGALTTPIQGGGAGTVLDQDQPEFGLSVPSGTAVYLTSVRVQLEVAADQDGDVTEILVAADRLAVPTTFAAQGTAEVAFNLRTDNPRTSLCTAASALTGNITNPTLGIELARKQMVTNVVTSGITQGIVDLVYEPNEPFLLVGPGAFYVYWGGTQATSGFAQIEWVELPEALNSLFGGS